MQRITAFYVPYLFAVHHVSAMEIMQEAIKSSIAMTDESTFICNFYDYLAGCTNVNIYATHRPPYDQKDFIYSRFFIENLLCDECHMNYYNSFLKTLRLFAIEIIAVSKYLQAISGRTIKILPTFPQKLAKQLEKFNLIRLESFQADKFPVPSESECEILTGWFISTHRAAGTYDFGSNMTSELCGKDPYTKYLAYLIKDLKTFDVPNMTRMLIYKEVTT